MKEISDFKDKLFLGFIYLFLFILGILVLLPVLYTISSSLTPYHEVLRRGGIILWPSKLTFEYYAYILNANSPVLRAFGVTLFVTVIGTLLSLSLTITAAYPLSKKYLPGKKFLTSLFVFTMLFNGGMIPTYLIVRAFGMIDSLWSLMIPTALSVYNMIVMRTFFTNIPESLEESAKLDGCNDIGVLMRIVIPTSGPVIATISLFYAVSKWNAFFDAYIYINDTAKYTLQVVIRRILVLSQVEELNSAVNQANIPPLFSLQMACAIVAVLPMVFFYPYLQKYFVKGVMIGSVKG